MGLEVTLAFEMQVSPLPLFSPQRSLSARTHVRKHPRQAFAHPHAMFPCTTRAVHIRGEKSFRAERSANAQVSLTSFLLEKLPEYAMDDEMANRRVAALPQQRKVPQ